MKTFLGVATCCLLSATLYAQNGLFIAPFAGAGAGSTHSNLYNQDAFFIYDVQKPTLTSTYTAGITVGYRLNKWELTTGVAYLQSGFAQRYDMGDFILEHVKHTEHETHIVIPVVADRRFHLTGRSYLSAGIGAALYQNIGAKYKDDISLDGVTNTATTRHTYTADEFNDRYHKTSLSGIGRVRYMYQLSPKLNIFAGPEFQYMLTSILKTTDYFDHYQHNYVVNMNLGVQLNLGK